MTAFNFEKLDLQGAYLIDNFHDGDNRGKFVKCYEKDIFMSAGIKFNLNETFTSLSAKYVVRGLHFQIYKPQAKIVCIIAGKVWDVIVDLRLDSPTYKKWISIELSSENNKALYIPRGFAHGFVALEDKTIMLYQCDGTYNKETDTGIIFNDPEINVKWPIDENAAIHSIRDLKLMNLAEYEKNPMAIEYGL